MRPCSIASFATSVAERSVATLPRHAASARRATGTSPAFNAATTSVYAWLNRRNPISRYKSTMSHASASSGWTAASSACTTAATATGGNSAATVATTPCCSVPALSFSSSHRA
jgi:hypothetical protein